VILVAADKVNLVVVVLILEVIQHRALLVAVMLALEVL
jgi:hypothetical protein